MKDISIEASQKAYLLYSHPAPGAMSGHCAFVIMKPNHELSNTDLALLRDEKIDYYFSMYPDVPPSAFRDTTYLDLLLKDFPAYSVKSYEDDVLMRGLSRLRFKNKKREDFSARALIESGLPKIPTCQGDLYLKNGQYDEAMPVPLDINLSTVKQKLNDINQKARWSMFAPLPVVFSRLKQIGFANKQAPSLVYNCCSALRESFKLHGATNKKTQERMSFVSLWLAAAVLSASFVFSAENFNVGFIAAGFALTAFVLLHQNQELLLAAHKNSANYFTDLNAMNRKVVSPAKDIINFICLLVGTVGSVKNENLLPDLFDFPGTLFRYVKEQSGSVGVEKVSQSTQVLNLK